MTTVPVLDDATQLAVWKRNDVKARRILMDEPSTKKLRRRLRRMMIQLSGQIPLIRLSEIQFLEILYRWIRRESMLGFIVMRRRKKSRLEVVLEFPHT